MANKQSELITFMKGISISAIVLYHMIAMYLEIPTIVKKASCFGGAGVHMFFICSGFGLALSYFNKPLNFFEFLKRRFLKIYVPYVIVIVVSFLMPYMYEGNDRLIAFLSHIFLFKMFIPQYESSFGTQFWFVSTIIQFYFIFNILMKIWNKIGNKILIATCFISILWASFTVFAGISNERIWSSFFLQYLWEFCLGICLADIYRNNKYTYDQDKHLGRMGVITVVSLIIFIMMSFSGGFLKNFNDLFSVLSFGGVSLLLYRIEKLKKIFVKISYFSYELYLLHILIFETIFILFSDVFSNIVLSALSIIVVCILSHMYNKIVTKLYESMQLC